MGNSFAKDINKVFGRGPAASQGGMAAGTSGNDWDGGGAPAGQHPGQGRPGQSDPEPNPTAPPTVPKYQAPVFYAPRQSQLQSATYNPSSTSHSYLQRYGVAKHV